MPASNDKVLLKISRTISAILSAIWLLVPLWMMCDMCNGSCVGILSDTENCCFCGKISVNNMNYEENCTLLGYYAMSSGNFLPTFRDNLSVPSSGFKNPKHSPYLGLQHFLLVSWMQRTGTTGCSKTPVRNYYYSLQNNQQGCSSQILHSRSLKSRT